MCQINNQPLFGMSFLLIVDYYLQINCIILIGQLVPHTCACLSNIKHHGERRFWGTSQRKKKPYVKKRKAKFCVNKAQSNTKNSKMAQRHKEYVMAAAAAGIDPTAANDPPLKSKAAA